MYTGLFQYTYIYLRRYKGMGDRCGNKSIVHRYRYKNISLLYALPTTYTQNRCYDVKFRKTTRCIKHLQHKILRFFFTVLFLAWLTEGRESSPLSMVFLTRLSASFILYISQTIHTGSFVVFFLLQRTE